MRRASSGWNVALGLRWGGLAAALLWWLSIRSYSSRTMYLLRYGSQAVVSPRWEVFVPMPAAALIVTLCGLAFLLSANELLWRRLCGNSGEQHGAAQQPAHARQEWLRALSFLLAASVPWLMDLAIHWQTTEPLVRATGIWGPSLWQPLWYAAFSGLAADRLVRALQASSVAGAAGPRPAHALSERWFTGSVLLAAFLCGAWWFVQSQRAYDGFMLGFNDCGHFAQRVAHTAAGRGWLIESPVLPRFWDHFNPGLTLLVPLWSLWPDMESLFLLQAVALAGSAPLILCLARMLGAGPLAASLWGLAWLAQPVLGQINLAYSYGWHPIALAIPLLLVALACLLRRRWWFAASAAALASTLEEGVLVIIATTAATCGAVELIDWLTRRSNWSAGGKAIQAAILAACQPSRRVSGLLPARTWLALAALTTLTFVLVFRFSGLAEFQTGRFHKLGASAPEILLSPVLRPDVFWGLLLRNRNAIFLLGILLPCGAVALARGWLLLVAAVLPLGVLLVWDHLPGQSLAFHYPSLLLPVFWLAAIVGATAQASASAIETKRPSPRGTGGRGFAGGPLSLGAAALVTSLVASITFGQFPWSSKNLGDVAEATYNPNLELQRRPGAADNQFAQEQLVAIRRQGTSVLATGRLATHLVGCSELETVGQFAQRRQALAKLTPGEPPLRRYRWLILDRREDFQQFPQQTAALEQEALASGFRIAAERYDIVVLSRE